MLDANTLLRDYNEYRFKTQHIANLRAQGRYPRSLKDSRENLAAFERLAAWCKARSIDPRHWLYSLFAARYWRFAPKLNQLCSERHLERYGGIETGGGHRQVVERNDVPVFDVNADISRAAELLKLRYLQLGQAGRCMGRSFVDTYGYHPQSEYCAQCPVAIACEAQLRAHVGFDITALRRGELTREQAMTLAAHGAR